MSEQLSVSREQQLTEKKPHWRRREKVYALLNQAPPGATYSQLVEFVRSRTGKGCSRKLISQWKKEQKIAPQQQPEPRETPERQPNTIPSTYQQRRPRQRNTRRRNTKLNYLALTSITFGLLGCIWLFFFEETPTRKNKPLPAIAKGLVQTSKESIPKQLLLSQQPSINREPAPEKPQSLSPRSLKISLFVTNPDYLQVKPGDIISKGQILADKPDERVPLLAKKSQLEISIKQAALSMATPPPAAPNFHSQEKALEQSKANLENETPDPGFQFKERWLQEIFEWDKVSQQNQFQQRKLEKTADIERSLAKLQETKAQYQQQLGQYNLQRERQQYELNSLQVQLAEVEGELKRVEAVKSPYSGSVKKVKVKGQKGNQIEVEVTVIPEK